MIMIVFLFMVSFLYFSQNNKIFTCEMPYPMDAYIRWSLRRRGWVEKFSNQVHLNMSRGGTSDKLEFEADEGEFENIIIQQGCTQT